MIFTFQIKLPDRPLLSPAASITTYKRICDNSKQSALPLSYGTAGPSPWDSNPHLSITRIEVTDICTAYMQLPMYLMCFRLNLPRLIRGIFCPSTSCSGRGSTGSCACTIRLHPAALRTAAPSLDFPVSLGRVRQDTLLHRINPDQCI